MGQKKELRSPGHEGLRNSSNRLARRDLVRGKKFLARTKSWRRNRSVADEAPTLRPRGAKQALGLGGRQHRRFVQGYIIAYRLEFVKTFF